MARRMGPVEGHVVPRPGGRGPGRGSYCCHAECALAPPPQRIDPAWLRAGVIAIGAALTLCYFIKIHA